MPSRWRQSSFGSAVSSCRDARWILGTEGYGAARSRLRRVLRKQQILWVGGSHLPGEIVLADGTPAREIVQPN